MFCNEDRPAPSIEDVKSNLDLMPVLLDVEGCFSWTQGAITVNGWYEWLLDLPVEQREILPDGTKVLCVHASPGNDDGYGIRAEMDSSELEELLKECDADLVCVGYTHRPFQLGVNNQVIVNPGSISNPVGTDVRASCAIIEANETGYRVEHRRVAYDQEAVIKVLEKMKHPSRNFITRHLRGLST